MLSSEIISEKIQELLGKNYILYPMARINTEFTTAVKMEDGSVVGRYTDEFTKLRKNNIIGVVTTINPLRANTDFYYVTAQYSIDFSVPTNINKYNSNGDLVEQPKFNFFDDISRLANLIINKKIQFNDFINGKITISEPVYKATETDGEIEYAIYTINGSVVLTDNATFGGDYKIEFFLFDDWWELDGVNSYNELMNNDTNAIIISDTTKINQNLAQLGWVCSFSIDDYETDNLARKLIYSIIHQNKEIINAEGQTEALKRKIRARVLSPYSDVHEFDAIVTISFTTTKNGIGTYNISLTDDNKNNDTYILSFNSNGGEPKYIEYKKLKYGENIGKLPIVTKEGFSFAGWYVGDTRLADNSSYDYKENKIAVAKWLLIMGGR